MMIIDDKIVTFNVVLVPSSYKVESPGTPKNYTYIKHLVQA